MPQKTPSRFHFPSPGFTKYWSEGRGRFLSKKIAGELPLEDEIEQKIPWLFQVDELADKVIREVMIPHGYPKTMQLLNQALSKGSFENLSAQGDSSTHFDYAQRKLLTTSIPQILIDLVEFSLQKPAWLDLEKVEIGAKLCRRSGTRGFMVLRNYCLMGGYESSAINKPLIFTGALKKGAAKRTTETTDFWVKVVAEHALRNPQAGIRECILIRLMHSYARVSILNGEGWRKDDWGEPLNQWDMVATNLGFSLVFLDGIRSLGVNAKPEEAEGLFHLWKYIGYLLGIPAELLPDTEEQAIRELYAWTITQPPADADTQELARALMFEPLSSNFPSKMWQKKRVIQLHLAYNYFFLGADSCRAMGLPVKGWSIFPFMLKNITRLQEIYYRTSEKAFENGVRKRRKNQEMVARLYLEGAKQKTENI